MNRKDGLDPIGAVLLGGITIFLAFNQIAIKITNGGFQPVFSAGLRSLGALVVLLLWMRFRGIPFSRPSKRVVIAGLFSGLLFAVEFILLFLALDLTTVSRATIIFYSMPVYLALVGHFLLPGETLSATKLTGLFFACVGVGWVLFDRSNGAGHLGGDIAALLAAFLWGGILLMVRLSPLSGERSEMQLFWQLAVSAVVMLAIAPLFGPLLRDPNNLHIAALAFQIVAVASFGFLAWFALVKIYPATTVASFSFLTPIIGVILSWALLSEQIGPEVIGGLALVVMGLFLVNRKR